MNFELFQPLSEMKAKGLVRDASNVSLSRWLSKMKIEAVYR